MNKDTKQTQEIMTLRKAMAKALEEKDTSILWALLIPLQVLPCVTDKMYTRPRSPDFSMTVPRITPMRRESASVKKWNSHKCRRTKNPFLLHAKVGSFLAREKYGVNDKAILDAITYHTTGRPNMSTLDKIIYIADYIEPGRRQASGLPEVRQLAFISLDDCLFRILKDTLDYLHASKMEIDMSTQQTYDYYKALQCEQKGGEIL